MNNEQRIKNWIAHWEAARKGRLKQEQAAAYLPSVHKTQENAK